MPQRLLRPGITNSERWNSIPWDAQSLYIRILTRVDDFGRCDGRASVIWASCFVIWNDLNPSTVVDLQQVAQMLQQLVDANLVEIYESEGKKVLQVLQWQERVRAGVKKWWPDKETCSNLQQLSRELLRSPSPSPSPSPSIAGTPAINANHAAFIKGWSENYLSKFGIKYDFKGGKDGVAVKGLMKLNIQIIDLLEIAKKAWDNPEITRYRSAASISGFYNNFNQIQAELKNANNKPNSRQGPDRNAGTYNANNDHEALKSKVL